MDTDRAIELIRDSGARVYVACTGAGAGLQGLLWRLPGSSSFLVGASFPYAADATDEFLGFRPEKYCSPETALDLATEAFLRAGAGPKAIGIGLTASVASHTAHRGDHRVHIAWLTARGAGAHDLVLEKGAGLERRTLDGEIADVAGLNAILDALGLEMASLWCGLRPSGRTTRSARRSEQAGATYVVSERGALARARFFRRPWFRADGTRAAAPETLKAGFPGTFDPPHEGHAGMAGAFEDATGRAPTFWVTADPPHKGPATLGELLGRARALRSRDVLFTEGDPLYLDKARKYPGCSFVIGADALARLLDPKWGVDTAPLIAELRALGTRFYVAGRVANGDLLSLADIPDAPLDLCTPLPGRWDVSSSELRRAG